MCQVRAQDGLTCAGSLPLWGERLLASFGLCGWPVSGGKGSKTSSLPGAAGPHCPPQGARVPAREDSDQRENHQTQIMASGIKSQWGNFT